MQSTSSRITNLEKEHEEAQIIILLLADLVHEKNKKIIRLERSITFGNFFRKFFAKGIMRTRRTIPTHSDALKLQKLSRYHPQIEVLLKKESFWRKYVIATSRRLRGKPHPRYQIVTKQENAENAGSEEISKQKILIDLCNDILNRSML